MSDVYATINYVLVNLINEIWEVEGKAIITDEFKDITNNDMHVIEAIGLGEGNNMSTIAKKLNITVGSLTTAYDNLRDDDMHFPLFPEDAHIRPVDPLCCGTGQHNPFSQDYSQQL